MSSALAQAHFDFSPSLRTQVRTGGMMMSPTNRGEGSPNLGWRAIDVLCDQFGRLPEKYAAEKIGVSIETWRTWKARRSKPSTDHLSRMFARLGPTFIAFVLSPFEESHLDMKAARIEAQIKALERELVDAKSSPLVRSAQGRPTRPMGGLVAGALNSPDT